MKKIEKDGYILMSHLYDDSHYNVVVCTVQNEFDICLVCDLLKDTWFLKYYAYYINSKESIPYSIFKLRGKESYYDLKEFGVASNMIKIHLSYDWPGTPFKCIR